jgi:multidrug transporter EmrE-like cation transporter
MMSIWAHLVPAAVLNIGTIYCLKASRGMTQVKPTIGVIVTILIVQWLMARTMHLGTDVATTTIVVVVTVMIGGDHRLLHGRPAGRSATRGLRLGGGRRPFGNSSSDACKILMHSIILRLALCRL